MQESSGFEWSIGNLFFMVMVLMTMASARGSFKVLPSVVNTLKSYSDLLETPPDTHWRVDFDVFSQTKNLFTGLQAGRVYGLPQNVKDMVRMHEGKRNALYKDSENYYTIGIGHFIGKSVTDESKQVISRVIGREWKSGETLSDSEIEKLFEYDFEKHTRELFEKLPFVRKLDSVRQAVLIDMYFNMGSRLLNFKQTLAYIENGQYTQAAGNMRASKWYSQVGNRSRRLCRMMETGRWL